MKTIFNKTNLLFVIGLAVGSVVVGQITNVNVGVFPNDNSGDPIRTAFQKLNANDNYFNATIVTNGRSGLNLPALNSVAPQLDFSTGGSITGIVQLRGNNIIPPSILFTNTATGSTGLMFMFGNQIETGPPFFPLGGFTLNFGTNQQVTVTDYLQMTVGEARLADNLLSTATILDSQLSANIANVTQSQTYSGIPTFQNGLTNNGPMTLNGPVTVSNLTAVNLYGNASGTSNSTPNTYRYQYPQNSTELMEIIAANISNGVPTSILFMGDSLANSGAAQYSIFDNVVGLPSILFSHFGYSGGGPDFNVDLGLNPSIWSRTGSFTNWFGNFATPVFTSDGTNAIRSKFSSSVMRTNSPTQLGVDYIANNSGGNISILWTNELGTNAVLSASGNASAPTYKRLLFNNFGAATNNQIFFTSVSNTNIVCGFVFVNTNIPGIQCWSAAHGGINLSNMLTAGASSLQAFANIIKPDAVLYTGKDNEVGSMGVPSSLSIYQSNLLNVLPNLEVAKTRVIYVTTVQQRGNYDNITQNNFARLLSFTNNWLYCDLGQYYPNWDALNNSSMMLDDSHPNQLGATIEAKTLADLCGINGAIGSNSVYYGTFHGIADSFVTPVTFQPTFNLGSLHTYTPQSGFYGTVNIGYNLPQDASIYEQTGSGVWVQPAATTESVILGNYAGNQFMNLSSNLNTTLSPFVPAANVAGDTLGQLAQPFPSVYATNLFLKSSSAPSVTAQSSALWENNGTNLMLTWSGGNLQVVTTPFNVQATFNLGALFGFAPQNFFYSTMNVGYNLPGDACVYGLVSGGIVIQPPNAADSVIMENYAGNQMMTANTNLFSILVPLTNSAGQLGYSAGSAAGAGLVGEVISSKVAVASAVALTTAISTNVTTINLTKGDWDVSGSVTYTNSGTTLPAGFDEVSSINTTANTVAFDGTEVYCGNPQTTVSDLDSGTLPIKQINVSSTTTVCLVGQATFSAGGVKAFGSIVARRIR